jgi:hypothetical protein
VKVGTKSVLFGAHCFFLHPWFVAAAWTKLYGFPWDLRLWVAFFVHDLGYVGKVAMDDEEGETHPVLGAKIMSVFDPPYLLRVIGKSGWRDARWHDFCLLHSRYYAKRLGRPFSRLCVADKLSFALTPRWLYLPMVHWSGEIHEYLQRAKNADTTQGHWKAADYTANVELWHAELCIYMRAWVAAHKAGAADTWTNAARHSKPDSRRLL